MARLIPGTEVGAVLAVAGGLGAAFFSARDGMSVAEAAAGSFKTAMDGVNDTVGSGVTLADKLTKSYEGMSSGMRKLEGLRLARETREQTRAITEQRSALDALLEEIESAAAARLGAGLFREGGSAAWAVQPASSRATRRRLCRMQSPRSVPARSTPTSSPPSSSAWARPAPSSRS